MRTENISPRYIDLDSWPAAEMIAAMYEGQLAAAAAVGGALGAIAAAVDDALPALSQGGRIVYAGAGTSARIAVQDGSELAPTFDWPKSIYYGEKQPVYRYFFRPDEKGLVRPDVNVLVAWAKVAAEKGGEGSTREEFKSRVRIALQDFITRTARLSATSPRIRRRKCFVDTSISGFRFVEPRPMISRIASRSLVASSNGKKRDDASACMMAFRNSAEALKCFSTAHDTIAQS